MGRGRYIVHPDPAVSRFAETNKIAPNLFCGLNGHSVAGRIAFQTADDDPDHFAFHVQQRGASLAALSGSIHA